MKKSIVSVLSIVLLFFLFGCSSNQNSIKIEGTPDSYSPLSSAVQGIQLSVSTPIAGDDIEYRWKTTGGTFFNNNDGTAAVEYTGKTVRWSCSLDVKSKCYAGDSTEINVIAYNTKTGKAVANGSIEITKTDAAYSIKINEDL
ncbi:MAG: hypothetical protein WCG21_03875 [Eubacteriales bacterium]